MSLLSYQVREVATLHLDGWSYSDLARSYGVTRNVIAGALHRAGVRSGRRWKLTAAQVREMRRRIEAGERREAVAADFRVHHSTISHIMTGRTWGDAA